MRELFIYYRVPVASAAKAREAVQAMQRELRAEHPELVARLLTRALADGTETWMETYALDSRHGPMAGIDAYIESAITQRAATLSPFIDGPRHHESFDSDALPSGQGDGA
jgi:hypothetical protein